MGDLREGEVSKLGGAPFDEAFRQAFRETMRGVDDKSAFRVRWSFGTRVDVLRRQYDDALAKYKGDADATDLVRKYLSATAYESFTPVIASLLEEDDRRRYIAGPRTSR